MEFVMAIGVLLFWLAILALALCVIWLPITISKKRGLDSEQKTGVACCTILGIFFFPLWIVGIVLACVLKPKVVEDKKDDDTDLERLEKLHTLYKNKVITKAEYDKQRKKIMA